MNKIQANVGQKVKVVDRLHGHKFPIGSIVVCTAVCNIDGNADGRFDYEDGSGFWFMEPEEYVILE